MRSLTFLQTLGNGAIGTVYLAEMNSGNNFRRQIAVKILQSLEENNKPFVSRVRDEARLLGLLQDDEILQVISLEKIQGRDAILMEYVEGTDLSHIVKSHYAISIRAVASIGAIAAGVLHRAHTAIDPRTKRPLNVIHRDIKPANIMITKTGGIKICDFGVAKARFEGQESITLDPDMLLGTLHYMDPDYIRTGEISPAADIYALGLSLLELLTEERFGNPKFKRKDHEERIEYLIARSQAPDAFTSLLRQMTLWDASSRISGKQCEQILYKISDDLSGMSLRRWAGETIPKVQAEHNTAEDVLQLLGKTIVLQNSAFTSSSSQIPLSTPEIAVVQHATNTNTTKENIQTPTHTIDVPTTPSWQTAQNGIFVGMAVGVLLFLLTLPFYL